MHHIFVLGDQLNRTVGPLAEAAPDATVVLMIESISRARSYPYHKQKLALLYSAMRHFRDELTAAGYTVCYRQHDGFEDGIAAHLAEYPGATLTLMEPADYGVASQLSAAVDMYGGTLNIVPNALWISTHADWERYARGKTQLRMEFFYRDMRRKTGWLMDGKAPAGGEWNYDAENRQTPPPGHQFPDRLRFPLNALTSETIAWVEATFPEHFGSSAGFDWPVTRADALQLLDDFVTRRLANFGPYEDAMVSGEPVLYHSVLSAAINLGLLTGREVCEAALGQPAIPLASIEGFVRQILGWREFMYHVYRTKMPAFRAENRLNHQAALPWFYWSGETAMRCVRESVVQLQATGHTHHIQRLMVLGNFALTLGVLPQEINDWFLATYVDAYDWVVSPNVIGMSQYADGGTFTSKPYASGGAYINRMSNYCGGCRYNPKLSTGPDACPFTTLYWDFLDRHSAAFRANPRMAVIINGWLKRDAADQAAIRAQADDIRRRIGEGVL